MSAEEPQPAIEPRPTPPLRPSLRTLLSLCVVLGSSLAVFGGWGIVVFAFVVGLAICFRHEQPVRALLYLAIGTIGSLLLIGSLLSPIESAPGAARRAGCANNEHQILAALFSYQQVHGCFPPAYVADKNGKPIHSWRVLILPHLGRDDLYKAYDFNEPWDGPHNKKLLSARPKEYVCPGGLDSREQGTTQTSYVAVVGSDAAWPGQKSRKPGAADFPGGLSKTVMLVEMADSGIPWTEPRDLALETFCVADTKPTVPVVSSRHHLRKDFFYTFTDRCGANVALADGSIHYLPLDVLSAEWLREILPVGAYNKEEIARFHSDSICADSYGEERYLNWPNIAALLVWLLSVGTLLVGAVRGRKRLSVVPLPASSTSGPQVE
jgi:hypothetical protein